MACQQVTHTWWSNSSQSLCNWRPQSAVIDTSKVLSSIRPTMAGPGRVLGRFVNDTWPAPAGPLYRPIWPRFLGPGRVLGQTLRKLSTLQSCLSRFATYSPFLLDTGSDAGRNPPGITVFSEDHIVAQHSTSHFTIWRKYWLVRTCPANHLWSGNSYVLVYHSSPFTFNRVLISYCFIPHLSKGFACFLKVVSFKILVNSFPFGFKCEPVVSCGRIPVIPARKRLSFTILRSTGLKALQPGACVAMNSSSSSKWMKFAQANLMVSLYRGFSSGPPSTKIIRIGLQVPSSLYWMLLNAFYNNYSRPLLNITKSLPTPTPGTLYNMWTAHNASGKWLAVCSVVN